jgi:dihydrofolate reductase
VVLAFAVSIDGFGAGPDQSLEQPLGVGGLGLHEWMFHTRTFATMHGGEGGDTGIDDDWARRSFEGIGAWILGRNMFARCAAPGPTGAGAAGGATSRRITCRCSC